MTGAKGLSEVNMPKPASNDCDIDAGGYKMNSRRVPEGVRRNLLRGQGWDGARGGLHVLRRRPHLARGSHLPDKITFCNPPAIHLESRYAVQTSGATSLVQTPTIASTACLNSWFESAVNNSALQSLLDAKLGPLVHLLGRAACLGLKSVTNESQKADLRHEKNRHPQRLRAAGAHPD